MKYFKNIPNALFHVLFNINDFPKKFIWFNIRSSIINKDFKAGGNYKVLTLQIELNFNVTGTKRVGAFIIQFI